MNDHFLTVMRQPSAADWTLSELQDMAGVRLCRGVEDELRLKKVHGESRIPSGVFALKTRYSPRFSGGFWTKDGRNIIKKKDFLRLPAREQRLYTPHDLIWITGVPGFEYVLLHWGNTDLDTEGCYVVGRSFAWFGSRQGVDASQDTYMALYPKIISQIERGGLFIEFRDAVQPNPLPLAKNENGGKTRTV